MVTADDLIADFFRREGWPQLTNRQADKGGWTKGGITAAAWGDYRNLGRPATPQELNAITDAQARAFFFDRHIAPYQWLHDPIRLLLADWSVTSWHDDPSAALQIQLAKLGFYKGRVDGVAGPMTRAAMQNLMATAPQLEHEIYVELVKARVRQLVNEALDDPKVQQFLKDTPDVDLHNLRGWVNRGLEFVA